MFGPKEVSALARELLKPAEILPHTSRWRRRLFGLWNKTKHRYTHTYRERERARGLVINWQPIFVWHFVVFERIPFSVFAELRCAPVLVLVPVLFRICSLLPNKISLWLIAFFDDKIYIRLVKNVKWILSSSIECVLRSIECNSYSTLLLRLS